MNLILQAIKSLIRKVENGVSKTVTEIGKLKQQITTLNTSLSSVRRTAQNAQTAADNAQNTADNAQTNADAAKSVAETVDDKLSTEITNRKEEDNKKIDKKNPTGTGSLSMNRAANSVVGKNSTALGDGCIALGLSQSAFGQYNSNTLEFRDLGWRPNYSAFRISKTGTYYYATEYAFNEKTGIYTLINPKKASGSEIFSIGVTGLFFVVGEYSNGDDNVKENTFSGNELIKTAGTDFSRSEKDTYYRIFTPNYRLSARSQIYDEKGTYIHIVGNGTSDTNRSNAHTLDWKGVPWYQGRPQFGGNAQDDGAQTVVANGDTEIILASSTADSTKKFKITVDDSGTLTATEVKE